MSDEIDRARAREYELLAALLSHSPNAELLRRLALLRGDASPLGLAHAALGEAAAKTDEPDVAREFFDLFSGLGQDSLLPYASHYLAGSLYGRPLVRLRQTFQNFGIETAAEHSEPEDHIAILCEVMAGLVAGNITGRAGADREFFENYLAGWVRRFFIELEGARSADFYARVGSLGRVFIEIEAEAFALSA
ncbi:TorD/DmsD family molecular chaperone [Bradyrhizobium sp.]|uniref:TorD/DmsD family molecular chaperone n=1 Tax=Bradyrhizobium sp. TaxID=376 RepID=UPI003C56943F